MFSLKKHYFDCIDAQGSAVIVYDAMLQCCGLSIPYSSLMVNNAQGATVEKNVLRRVRRDAAGKMEQGQLNVRGTWSAQGGVPAPICLLHQDRRILDWHCHTPKARCRVEVGKTHYRGWGYAETMELNFAPWLLPINELRWGRFLSPQQSLVWIEWRGAQPLKVLLHNGQPSHDFCLNDAGLLAGNTPLRLLFERPIIIKDQPLFLLAQQYPFLRLLMKNSFLQTRETKWKSRARLITPHGEESGWALYETVLWKK